MEFAYRVLSIECLASMCLARHGYAAGTIQILYDERMLSEPSFLLPGQRQRRGKIKCYRYLRFYFVHVLPAGAARACERKMKFPLRN